MAMEQGVTRRAWLAGGSAGFGMFALRGLLGQQAAVAEDAGAKPLAAGMPHFLPRAKRVIFLCMRGGPSHVETFDYKPKLFEDHGKPGRNEKLKLLASRWKFSQAGQSGLWISELFPELARQVDRLCLLRGMHADSENHPQALEQLHTGNFQFIRPSMGAWVLYGLGTENQSLPGFISLTPLTALGGLRYYGNAFLPAAFSATTIGREGQPIRQAKIGNLSNPRLNSTGQRRQLDLLAAINRNLAVKQPGDPRFQGLADSFELAYRMQSELPQVMDLVGESPATLALYGIDQKPTDNFGRQCLLARRMVEAGVRFVEITHTDWDHHSFLTRSFPQRCEEIDRPIAGLLADLAQRGLLDETLVVWGGEFGRTPDNSTDDGRGHNSKGFSMWLAGGGTRSGFSYGNTDEYGYEAIEGRMHIHDLHATMLHLLGIDHERLTYRHGGRDFRLTDVQGRVVQDILL